VWLPPLQGTAYYVQVSAYNMKGWGPPQASVPPFAIPSSKYHWEDLWEPAAAAGWMGEGSSSCAIRRPAHSWDGVWWTWEQRQHSGSQPRQGGCARRSRMLPPASRNFAKY